mmetsp:Transcript_27700/g.71352  ORF Transcript_27700/g.71352 Transcript_27700/m.71352 type:complete len:230 (+) Transcript_27700:1459-2148(+)
MEMLMAKAPGPRALTRAKPPMVVMVGVGVGAPARTRAKPHKMGRLLMGALSPSLLLNGTRLAHLRPCQLPCPYAATSSRGQRLPRLQHRKPAWPQTSSQSWPSPPATAARLVHCYWHYWTRSQPVCPLARALPSTETLLMPLLLLPLLQSPLLWKAVQAAGEAAGQRVVQAVLARGPKEGRDPLTTERTGGQHLQGAQRMRGPRGQLQRRKRSSRMWGPEQEMMRSMRC